MATQKPFKIGYYVRVHVIYTLFQNAFNTVSLEISINKHEFWHCWLITVMDDFCVNRVKAMHDSKQCVFFFQVFSSCFHHIALLIVESNLTCTSQKNLPSQCIQQQLKVLTILNIASLFQQCHRQKFDSKTSIRHFICLTLSYSNLLKSFILWCTLTDYSQILQNEQCFIR